MGWLNDAAAAAWDFGHWFGGFGRTRREDPQDVADLTGLLLSTLGYSTKAGVTVSAETALRVTDVLACTRVLAEGVGQCPIKVMKKEGTKRREAPEHPLYDVLAVEPNEDDTSFTFRETLMYHAVMTPNAYAFINRVRGNVREIIPIKPGYMTFDPDRPPEKVYRLSTAGGAEDFSRDQIFHLTGPRWSCATGLDVIGLARDAIGLAIALEGSQSSLHKNGMRPSIALMHEKGQDEPSIKRLKALIKITHAGSDNFFRPLFLDNGWKIEKLQMSGADAQTMEARLHQLRAICRAMRVFPQMVGDSDKTSTYASAEQFFIAHVTHSLLPWVTRFEQMANKRFLTKEDRRAGYYIKIFTEGLLRGDSRARAAFYQVMVLTGIFTRNECRELEDRNDIEGLDDPLVPLNMGVAGQPDAGDNADGTRASWSVTLPNVPIAPLSRLGHNGGPPIDDAAALQKAIQRLQAMGDPRWQDAGRVLSAKNERRIREAGDLIGQADSKLVEVLAELGPEEDAETEEDRK